jgi:hypothetical protein
MQATLIRFSPDILEAIRAEARASGVSVAQFVREATLARVAYMAGRRGNARYDDALERVTRDGRGPAKKTRLQSDNAALLAEAKVATRHARQLKAESAAARERRA